MPVYPPSTLACFSRACTSQNKHSSLPLTTVIDVENSVIHLSPLET
jgi:hypothetical protein